MKLIKLEILNLASLDKEGGEVINFEEGVLGDTSIFSIVGTTGSGKSTLLDAICLALYNRAPRYPRKKGDRSQKIEIYGTPEESERNRLAPTDGRNILTQGKKDGYSKLTFLANNGNVYRAEWHVRFLRKNFDEANTYLYMIQHQDGEYKEVEQDWKELPQIIGLEYDQFLRTVLIAQGSFANFLTADEDERFKLLEKLIGCEERYVAIAGRIKEKRDAAMERYRDISAQVESFRQFVLKEEDLNSLKEQIETLEKAEKELNEQIKGIDKALEWYVEEGKLTEKISKRTQEEALASSSLEEIKSDIDRLTLHDAISPAVDILREVRRLESEIKKVGEDIVGNETKIAKQKEDIEDGNKQLSLLEERVKVAQDAIDRTTPLINKARELNTRITVADMALSEKKSAMDTAKTEMEKAGKKLENNTKAIETSEKEKSDAEKALDTLNQSIEKRLKELSDAEKEAQDKLQAEQEKIEGLSGEDLTQAKDKASENLSDIKGAIEILGRINEHSENLSNHLKNQEELEKENNDFTARLATLPIDDLQKEVNTLQNTYTLMTSQDWKSHRSKLKDGEPCPLCGSIHHPFSQDDAQAEAATSELYQLLDKKRSDLEEQSNIEEELQGKVSENNGKLSTLKTEIPNVEKKLKEEEEKWSETAGNHADWPKDKATLEGKMPLFEDAKKESEKKLNEFLGVQKSIRLLTIQKEKAAKDKNDYERQSQEELRKGEKKIASANTTLESHKAQTSNLQQQLQEKQENHESAKNAYGEAKLQLDNLKKEFNAQLGGKNPDEVEKQLKKSKEDADKGVAAKNKEIVNLQTRLGELQGALATQCEEKRKVEEDKGTRSQELNAWIENYNLNASPQIEEEDVASMLDAKDDWESIRRKKGEREKALTSARALKAGAEKDLEVHRLSKPEKSSEELKLEKETLEQNSRNQELQGANLRLKQHENAIKSMGDKGEELEKATSEKEDWEAIVSSIGSDGNTLRKIAQCYTMRFLVEHANAEIRKFNRRYELQQVKNSLGLRVIDHDRADNVRDTTSISGGETFIVSLGLALGLSSLSSRNISFDNLFIDEGFGTLDPETLATVIDSLAMLQTSQGKKVGVISHTDTMSERITTQIRIIKNGNSGSSRIEIYP